MNNETTLTPDEIALLQTSCTADPQLKRRLLDAAIDSDMQINGLTLDEIAVLSNYRALDKETRQVIQCVLKLNPEDKPPLGTRNTITGRVYGGRDNATTTKAKAWAMLGQMIWQDLIAVPDLDQPSSEDLIAAAEDLLHVVTMLELSLNTFGTH